jgi:uncharacterized phage protein (TIGR01671 family)
MNATTETMKQRELKFRVWSKSGKYWTTTGMSHGAENGKPCTAISGHPDLVIMQATGRKDKEGKEIYESDIFRVEEPGDEQDLVYYLVIVWVQEWAMFATLRVDDEYPAYLREGVSALDEPMFWTYTLEDTNDRRFYLCGDIYSTPHLLEGATGVNQ